MIPAQLKCVPPALSCARRAASAYNLSFGALNWRFVLSQILKPYFGANVVVVKGGPREGHCVCRDQPAPTRIKRMCVSLGLL